MTYIECDEYTIYIYEIHELFDEKGWGLRVVYTGVIEKYYKNFNGLILVLFIEFGLF